MKQCGSCTLCCKLIGVTELNKPPNKWCEHCAPGKECKIYEERPSSCREFQCGWLLSDLPDDLRPDRIHVILTGESYKQLNAFIVHCDPNYPDAIHNLKAKRLLDAIAQVKPIIVITGNKRKLIANNQEDILAVKKLIETVEM